MGDYDEFLPEEGPPSAGLGESALDVAKQVGARLWEGVVDLPGLPGDTLETAKRVGTWLGDQVNYVFNGVDSSNQPEYDPLGVSGALPTSQEFKEKVGFERRKPTTSAGKSFDESILGDITEGASAAVLTGPKKIIEGGLRRVIPETAKAVIKYDAAPRVVGKGARKAAEAGGLSEGWQDAAETVASIGTAGIAGVRTLPNLAAQTRNQIRQQGSRLFEAARKQGVAFQRPVIQTLASDIDQEIRSMGFNKKIHPQSWALVKEIRKTAADPGPMDYVQYNTLRELASDAMGSAAGGDLKRASRVARILDKFMAQPPAGSFTGNPKVAAKLAKEARSLWSRQHKVKIIEKATERVKNADPNLNEDAATRSAFRTIANNEDLMSQFSQAEREAIKEVVRAGKFEKMTKWLARWSIATAPLRGAGLGYLGHTLGGGPGVVAALAGPEAAREGLAAITRRSAQKVDTLVRRGDNVNIDMWPGKKPSLKAGMYYAGESARRRRSEIDDPYAEFLP